MIIVTCMFLPNAFGDPTDSTTFGFTQPINPYMYKRTRILMRVRDNENLQWSIFPLVHRVGDGEALFPGVTGWVVERQFLVDSTHLKRYTFGLVAKSHRLMSTLLR